MDILDETIEDQKNINKIEALKKFLPIFLIFLLVSVLIISYYKYSSNKETIEIQKVSDLFIKSVDNDSKDIIKSDTRSVIKNSSKPIKDLMELYIYETHKNKGEIKNALEVLESLINTSSNNFTKEYAKIQKVAILIDKADKNQNELKYIEDFIENADEDNSQFKSYICMLKILYYKSLSNKSKLNEVVSKIKTDFIFSAELKEFLEVLSYREVN